jgi:hypothetical protein
MFNILVTYRETAWETDQLMRIDVGRFGEYSGAEAAPAETNVVGVKIRDDLSMKLFKKGDTPVLRGTAFMRNDRQAALWTCGWTPRLGTYPGVEVPNPLSVEICRGESSIEVVLNDIMALTKLNSNACLFADGSPITLKFANAVARSSPPVRCPPAARCCPSCTTSECLAPRDDLSQLFSA